MEWVDYGGQDHSQYEFIGTDEPMFPISGVEDISPLVEEIRRRCGRLASIRLFRKEKVNEDR